jgi:hypothetical protein
VRHIPDASQVQVRPGGRPIVDDDQFPRLSTVALERGDALLGEFDLVPALCGEPRYVAFSHRPREFSSFLTLAAT